MSSPDSYAPWTYSTWALLTKTSLPIFHPDFPPKPGRDASTLSAVREYAAGFWDADLAERDGFAAEPSDKHHAGREIYAEWINEGWKRWKINAMIDRTLVQVGASPHELIKMDADGKVHYVMLLRFIMAAILNLLQLPGIMEAGIQSFFPRIADDLFGRDAYREPMSAHRMLKRGVNEFVSTVMQRTWERYRKGLRREKIKMRKWEDEIEEMWRGMCQCTF